MEIFITQANLTYRILNNEKLTLDKRMLRLRMLGFSQWEINALMMEEES